MKWVESRKGVFGVGNTSKNRAKLVAKYVIDGEKFNNGEVDGEFDNKVDDEVGKNQKMSKFKKLSKTKITIISLDFLIPRAKLAFTKLR